MAKCDINSAFCLFPVRPEDHHLLGFYFDNKYFYDTTMPMGCASSCRSFERFAGAIHWIAQTKFGCTHLQHFLDDYLILGETSDIVARNLAVFQNVCQKLGVPLAPEKTVGPPT